MDKWLVWSVLAMIFWGFWGLFPKLAVQSLTPATAFFYEALACALIAAVMAAWYGGVPQANLKGVSFAVLTALAGMGGALMYLYAAKEASISSVVVITSLYPILTVCLSVAVIGESVGIKKVLALVLCLTAIALVALEEHPAAAVEGQNAAGPADEGPQTPGLSRKR